MQIYLLLTFLRLVSILCITKIVYTVLKIKEIIKMLFFYQGSNKGGMQGIVPVARFDHDLSLHFVSGLPCPPSAFAPMVCDLKLLRFLLFQVTFLFYFFLSLFFCQFYVLFSYLFLLSGRGLSRHTLKKFNIR